MKIILTNVNKYFFRKYKFRGDWFSLIIALKLCRMINIKYKIMFRLLYKVFNI